MEKITIVQFDCKKYNNKRLYKHFYLFDNYSNILIFVDNLDKYIINH